MPSRFFGEADIPRLERAVAEARRLKINAMQAETALQDALMREGQRQAKAVEQAADANRRSAERELRAAMPGWMSRLDVPRLERAISAAAALGVDVHHAKRALDKERSAREGERVRSSQTSAPAKPAPRPPTSAPAAPAPRPQFSDKHLKRLSLS